MPKVYFFVPNLIGKCETQAGYIKFLDTAEHHIEVRIVNMKHLLFYRIILKSTTTQRLEGVRICQGPVHKAQKSYENTTNFNP